MKLLSVIMIIGLLWWMGSRSEPQKPAPVVAAPTATPVPVPFSVKAKVKHIVQEWRRLREASSRGDTTAARRKIELALRDIRARLSSDGLHSPSAQIEVMTAAAIELGHDQAQAAHMIAEIAGASGSMDGDGLGFAAQLRKVAAEAAGLPVGGVAVEAPQP